MILPDNYQLSLNRLQKLKHKLIKKPKLLYEYEIVFREYKDLGIIEKVETPGDIGQVYLPHNYQRRKVNNEISYSVRCKCKS